MAERLTLDEAAHRLGVSARTVRRRIKAGTLAADLEPTPQGYRYWVLLDEAATQPTSQPSAEPESALLAEVRAERDYLRGLVSDQQRTIAEQQETIAQLVRQHENAQVLIGQAQRLAELPAAGQTGATPASQPVAPTSRPGSHGQRPLRRRSPWWLRVLRALRG